MKANELEAIQTNIRSHINSALIYLYKMAEVGDNKLELGKHAVTYSDGFEYEITAIEVDFTHDPKGELIFHQTEVEDRNEDVISGPSLETLTQVLAAVEVVVEYHDSSPLAA